MSELVTFMKKLMTMLSEKQKAVEELLMILLFTSIIFSIEGFLDGKLISKSNELNMIIEHAKRYWIFSPILIVFIVIFIYMIIRNKYLKRIINYPAFTFKFDRWIISIILSIVLYWNAVHFGLLQGSLIVPTKILDGSLLAFYLLVFILRKKKLSLECNKKEENEEELDEQSYSSDIAIKESKDDKLNRTEFAKRLVASVNSWKEEESIVIGLYGEWGTGKTSVLNLMQEGLNKKQNTIIVPFNPWYFKDEEQLILLIF